MRNLPSAVSARVSFSPFFVKKSPPITTRTSDYEEFGRPESEPITRYPCSVTETERRVVIQSEIIPGPEGHRLFHHGESDYRQAS